MSLFLSLLFSYRKECPDRSDATAAALLMPKLSPKRQITLPAALCRELDVEPGDELDVFAVDGRLTLVKKRRGAARGLLRNVKGDRSISDEESRDSALR